MWDLIVSVPDHCLSFYFQYILFMLYLQQDEDRIKLHVLNAYFLQTLDKAFSNTAFFET